MTNVTAFHGQAAVHLGGYEFNDRWSPACGTQHHNVGGREVTPLEPTDKAVTCKRCLKLRAAKPELKEIPNYAVQELKASRMSPDASPTAKALAEASAFRDRAMREAHEAEGTTGQAYADKAYEYADKTYKAASAAHRAAREANGDFRPRKAREQTGIEMLQDMLKLS